MASIIQSIEYVEILFDIDNVPRTVNLTKGQDETKCVPFYTVEHNAALTDDWRDRMFKVEIIDNAGTPATKISAPGRSSAANQDSWLRVFVVEFISSINVQQVVFDLTVTEATQNFTITDVTAQNSAFMLLSYDFNDAGLIDAADRALLKLEFNGASTTSITISRVQNDGVITGVCYIVDCDSSEFIVDHQTFDSVATDEITTQTISSTVMADTFIISHYSTAETTDDPRDASVIVELQNSTTIRCRRAIAGASNAVNHHAVQVIECQGNQWSVQRGDITMNTTPETAAITAVTQANSIVKTGTHEASVYDMGTSDATNGNNVDACSTSVVFNSNTEIEFERNLDNETGNVIAWEVIDFTGDGGGAVSPISAGGMIINP